MAGLPEDVAGALHDTGATTLHRLLGLRGSGKPRHDRFNPLPHDMVVVDETSMVSLPLMARLLDAVRPDATLVLVGDPFQLVSVEVERNRQQSIFALPQADESFQVGCVGREKLGRQAVKRQS